MKMPLSKTEKMMRNNSFCISILLAALILVFSTSAKAQEKTVAAQASAAEISYNEGNYSNAISLYEELIKNHGVSVSSLFNLGNAYMRSGNLGKARLCYERAKRLSPDDGRIENNLAYVSSKVDDANAANSGKDKNALAPDSPSFFDSVYDSIAVETPSNRWAVLAAVSFILLIAAIAAYIFSSNVTARKVGFFGSMGFLALAGLFIAFSFMSAKAFERQDEGIVTSFKTNLLSSPDVDAKTSSPPLVQGTKFHIEETSLGKSEEEKWYRVRINSKTGGWIKSTDCEPIKSE